MRRYAEIGAHAGRNQLSRRTQPLRFEYRHSGFHAVFLGLVGSGEHNAVPPGGVAAHDDRTVAQGRVEGLFHTGVKRVHIRQENNPFPLHASHSPNKCSIYRISASCADEKRNTLARGSRWTRRPWKKIKMTGG